MTELDAAYDRERTLNLELLQRIAATQAQSLEGIGAKASAVAIASGRHLQSHEDVLSSLLTRVDRDRENTEEMLAVSLIVDAMKLGTAAPASSGAQVAA